MKRSSGLALAAALALTFIGSTCDLAKDECNYQDPTTAFCTADNTAVCAAKAST